jgi:hypothetical protein
VDNARSETSRILRDEEREHLKDKINKLEEKSNNKNTTKRLHRYE